MTEKDLIQKIKNLKETKPNPDWVVFAKREILNGDEAPSFAEFLFGFAKKPSLALASSFLLLVGIFVSAQNAVPGDALFALKKASEKGHSIFLVSQDKKNDYNLYLANKRLEELSKLATTKNEISRLNSALEELKTAKREIENEFAKQVENRPREEAMEIARNIAGSLMEIEKRETVYMETFGVKAESSDESTNKRITEFMLTALEEKELEEEDTELLSEAKDYYEAGEYSLSLRKMWQIGADRSSSDTEGDKESDL